MFERIRKEIMGNADGCFDSDWDKIFAAMEEIFTLTEKARREGILALEDGYEEIKNEDFKYSIGLVLEGIDCNLVEEYIENMYYATLPRGTDGIIFLIYAYGAAYIQTGVSPNIIKMLFQSIVPRAYRDKIIYDEDRARKQHEKDIEQALKNNSLEKVIKFISTDDAFSFAVMSLSDEEFKILRNVYFGEDCWSPALKYSSSKLINRVLKDESRYSLAYIVDSINAKNYTKEESDKAKEIILDTINNIKWKESMALEGRATEAFELGPIEDDFSKQIMELSDRQIRELVQKIEETDLRYALAFSTTEVINKFAANLEPTKLFHICNNLLSRSRWEKEKADESKEKILDAIKKYYIKD